MKTNQQSDAKGDTLRWLRGLFSLDAKTTATDEMETGRALRPVPTNGKTILVVDDDPVFLKATAIKFENNGFKVITARDGSEAIQVVRKTKPDLLVLDVNLSTDIASGGSVPWDGFRIVSWLRRFDELGIIPVVITSSGDPVENTRLAIRSGAVAFFHKQMNPNQLLSIVNNTLARSGIIRTPALEENFQI